MSPRHDRDDRDNRHRARDRDRNGTWQREPGRDPRPPRIAPWLEVLDDVVGDVVEAVEVAAWEARGVAARAAEAFRGLEGDWDDVADGWRDVAAEWTPRFTRLGSQVGLLADLALSYRVQRLREAFVSPDKARDSRDALHRRSARRFAEAGRRHGGGFMKLGQLLSARPDLLPEVWIAELSRLQDAGAPVPFGAIREAVERDLGGELETHFQSFDVEPIASASIGQVHAATTHDGRDVAVKVQRPDIGRVLDADLDLLDLFLDTVGSALPPADWDTILGEVRARVRGELDYRAEVAVMTRIGNFFADHPSIRVPRPLPELCGRRVITAEMAHGHKISDALDAYERAAGAGGAEGRGAREEIARTLGLLLEAYARQVLEAGVFQADPHPGNLLVSDAGELVLLDFGCSQELSPEQRDRYAGLLRAFFARDRGQVADALAAIGFETESGNPDTLLRLADDMLETLRRADAEGAFPWLSPDELLARAEDLLETARRDPVVSVPDEFVMLARVFGAVGGLFRKHRPEIDPAALLGQLLARRA